MRIAAFIGGLILVCVAVIGIYFYFWSKQCTIEIKSNSKIVKITVADKRQFTIFTSEYFSCKKQLIPMMFLSYENTNLPVSQITLKVINTDAKGFNGTRVYKGDLNNLLYSIGVVRLPGGGVDINLQITSEEAKDKNLVPLVSSLLANTISQLSKGVDKVDFMQIINITPTVPSGLSYETL
jgi:hypothetical protein